MIVGQSFFFKREILNLPKVALQHSSPEVIQSKNKSFFKNKSFVLNQIKQPDRKFFQNAEAEIKKIQQSQNNIKIHISQEHVYLYFAQMRLDKFINEIYFEKFVISLTVQDPRCDIVTKILSEVFNEFIINPMSLLICQHKFTKNYYVYFTDTKLIPFSLCCGKPIHVIINPFGIGYIQCNSQKCGCPTLNQFNFHKFTNKIKDQISPMDKQILFENNIAKMVKNGQHRYNKLLKTQKQIAMKSQKLDSPQRLRTNAANLSQNGEIRVRAKTFMDDSAIFATSCKNYQPGRNIIFRRPYQVQPVQKSFDFNSS